MEGKGKVPKDGDEVLEMVGKPSFLTPKKRADILGEREKEGARTRLWVTWSFSRIYSEGL